MELPAAEKGPRSRSDVESNFATTEFKTPNDISYFETTGPAMSQKAMEWPGLSAALAGFLPLRPDMRQLVPGAEGLMYTPAPYKYSYINQKSFALALVLAISAGLSALMWLTSAYDNAILKLVSIRDDIDTVFENWRSPPTKSRLQVHIFNYTNFEAFLEGNECPRVQEVGPYVFREKMERTNVVFNKNGTVSFQEIRNITPLPEVTNGSFSDTIWVPNIPYLTIVNHATKRDYGVQTALYYLSDTAKFKIFLNVTVDDFIWGIKDGFFEFLSRIRSFMGNDVKPFGFLAKRKGVHHDIVTMYTGSKDLDTVGLISHWNGASRIGHWGNTTCDIITSSDGSMFPGQLAMKGEPLYVYASSMCRRIPLRFNRTTSSKDGFPVQQYNVDENMFDYTSNPENSCYKYNGKYPLNGVFTTAPCQGEAPIYASFPHFWKGDPVLLKDVEGLTPDPEKHYSYFQIHEKLGIVLRARTRFQLNILLKKPHFFKNLALKKEVILPIAWLDYDSGELNEDFKKAIFHLTYTVMIVEEFLKWILLSVTVISFSLLLLEVKKCVKK